MADINFSFNPIGGEVDKYKVTLYNAAGTSVITTRTFTPTFPSTITGTFTGLTNGTTYNVSVTEYIGAMSKECPLKSVVANGGGTINNFIFTYGETEADTTGAPLTEMEYVTSVTDAIATGNVYTDSETLGGNISVDDFANDSDKVLFIAVPSTEPAFTKWSEVGNIYQQDQPIDQSFATGSNVIFMSVQGATTYYITRSQTDFVGALVLSR